MEKVILEKKEKHILWSENYLLTQGYSREIIDKYFYVDNDLVKKAAESLFCKIVKNKKKERKALLLFGQPGSGKSTYIKNNASDFVVLDLDEFRLYHPYKEDIVSVIEANHSNNILPVENTKGRDFTNFTRRFIGLVFDMLLDKCVSEGYNVAMQKHASSYSDLESLFKFLVVNNYHTTFVSVVVSARTSWERCVKRNELNNMTLNTVSKDFHDNYINNMPQTIIDFILHYVYEQEYIENFKILSGENVINIDKTSKIDINYINQFVRDALLS